MVPGVGVDRCRTLPRATFALLFATCAGAAFAQEPVPSAEPPPEPDRPSGLFLWTDTSVSVLPYGYGFEVDPREQSTLTIEHAHASKIGDFFGFVDFTKFHGA